MQLEGRSGRSAVEMGRVNQVNKQHEEDDGNKRVKKNIGEHSFIEAN